MVNWHKTDMRPFLRASENILEKYVKIYGILNKNVGTRLYNTQKKNEKIFIIIDLALEQLYNL